MPISLFSAENYFRFRSLTAQKCFRSEIDSSGATPLHQACREDNEEIAEFLVREGLKRRRGVPAYNVKRRGGSREEAEIQRRRENCDMTTGRPIL